MQSIIGHPLGIGPFGIDGARIVRRGDAVELLREHLHPVVGTNGAPFQLYLRDSSPWENASGRLPYDLTWN
ncbi:MAG TPA: hypothetical protein VK540_21210 [Polyangiaceae bacterium]|nr:hypothetical protein [Polyangiaceae bacterium]